MHFPTGALVLLSGFKRKDENNIILKQASAFELIVLPLSSLPETAHPINIYL